jgi:hypothetical protein
VLFRSTKVMALMAVEMCSMTRDEFRSNAPKNRGSLVF